MPDKALTIGRNLRAFASTIGFSLIVLICVFHLSTGAKAQVPGDPACSGRFVNPITDICWDCLFPLTLGAIPIWPSEKPDPENPPQPICLCQKLPPPAPPIPGLAMGFWEPVRLVDVTKKPFCFVNLGGISLNPGIAIGQKDGDSVNRKTASWHVHWYTYPLVYWLELLNDAACLEVANVDIAYITEVDPLWQSDELTMLLNPEGLLFGNFVAQAACAADCATASVALPLDPLFWCAGCLGGMYPLNGNIQAEYGHIQGAVLAASRMAYKLHRQGLLWQTGGIEALCSKLPQPIMRKSMYRTQLTNPIPTVIGLSPCSPIGRTQTLYESFKMVPVIGEDFGVLMWRKRNCCVL